MRQLIFAASLLLAACGQGAETPDIRSGYIRLPAEGATMSAAYLTILRDADDRLVGATVEGVERTELHTVIETDGISRMRPVEGFDLEADQPLVLQPGGHHLMLIGLSEPLTAGEERRVTLDFESGATETLQLPVRGSVVQGNGNL